jgi:hypothetical protein
MQFVPSARRIDVRPVQDQRHLTRKRQWHASTASLVQIPTTFGQQSTWEYKDIRKGHSSTSNGPL